MKKFLSIVLSTLMIFTCMSTNVFARDVSPISITVDETYTVTLNDYVLWTGDDDPTDSSKNYCKDFHFSSEFSQYIEIVSATQNGDNVDVVIKGKESNSNNMTLQYKKYYFNRTPVQWYDTERSKPFTVSPSSTLAYDSTDKRWELDGQAVSFHQVIPAGTKYIHHSNYLEINTTVQNEDGKFDSNAEIVAFDKASITLCTNHNTNGGNDICSSCNNYNIDKNNTWENVKNKLIGNYLHSYEGLTDTCIVGDDLITITYEEEEKVYYPCKVFESDNEIKVLCHDSYCDEAFEFSISGNKSSAVKWKTDGIEVPFYCSYTITKDTAEHGSFTVKKGSSEVTSATENSEIIITPIADSGYEVDKVEWKKTSDSGYTTITNNNGYKFSMPAENVSVNVTFSLSTPTHTWTYSVGTGADANKLTASCDGTSCSSEAHNVSLTLTATSQTYSGSAITKTSLFSGMDFSAFNSATGKNLSVSDIELYAASDTSKTSNLSEVTASGSYNAYLTVEGKTATCNVTVTAAKDPETETPETKAPETETPATKTKLEKKITLNSKFSVTTGKRIEVTWGKVADADGYDIYMSYCGDKLALVASTKSTDVTIKKLKKKAINQNKHVKCYVAAYKMVDGTKKRIAKTITAHAVGRKNTKATDAKKISLQKSSYTLAKGKTATIKAKTIKKNPSLPILSKNHTSEFRYISSNSDVAAVSKSGKITAKGTGTCYIWVYAVNGCAKKVNVNVK